MTHSESKILFSTNGVTVLSLFVFFFCLNKEQNLTYVFSLPLWPGHLTQSCWSMLNFQNFDFSAELSELIFESKATFVLQI